MRRPVRSRCRGRPSAANGDAIAGYYVQRLVEGASGVPTGPQACTVTTPAPGTVVPPSSGGTVTETVAVSPGTTSIRFSGTSSDSTRYSFIVWGYNRAGCVNTEVAGAVVRPGPGVVTDVRSSMDYNGPETWDRYIDGVDVAAPRVQIVAVASNGAQIAGSVREFRGTGWLRDLFSDPSRFAFGQTARFQVRGCTDWGTCGPWSQVMPERRIAVAHVRAAESRVEQRDRHLVVDDAARQLRTAGHVPLRHRGDAEQPGRPDRDELPHSRRAARRHRLVGC